jgi:quinolinate synthase
MAYDIISEIKALKKEKDALILAHYYEDGAIQDLADHVGDSFALAKWGQQSQHKVILLAGVVFMAESVKLLNPEKTVLAPDMNAGCSLVEGSPADEYLAWRQKYPNGIAVTYINSSTEVKAISDVIVTSSNALQIIKSIPEDRPILFGPDQNLGRFLEKQSGRKFVLWPGSCEVHVLFSAQRLFELFSLHPDAIILAHPECEENVLKYAHVIGSTSRLLDEVKKNPAKKFIVATEAGIMHQMAKERPDAELIQAPINTGCACNNCPYMKLNTLEKIKSALQNLSPSISIDPTLASRAKISLERMMDITAGKAPHWPSTTESDAKPLPASPI